MVLDWFPHIVSCSALCVPYIYTTTLYIFAEWEREGGERKTEIREREREREREGGGGGR